MKVSRAIGACVLLSAIFAAAWLTWPSPTEPLSANATDRTKTNGTQRTRQQLPETSDTVVPPPPHERFSGSLPRFVSASVVHMSREDRWARARLLAANGPYARYMDLNPTTLPKDERMAAQRRMIREQREMQRDPSRQPTQALRRALDEYQVELWAQGSTELARWLFERSVDIQGAMSDGPADPDTVAKLACPIAEAAMLCEALGYRRCSKAPRLAELAQEACTIDAD